MFFWSIIPCKLFLWKLVAILVSLYPLEIWKTQETKSQIHENVFWFSLKYNATLNASWFFSQSKINNNRLGNSLVFCFLFGLFVFFLFWDIILETNTSFDYENRFFCIKCFTLYWQCKHFKPICWKITKHPVYKIRKKSIYLLRKKGEFQKLM